MFENGIERESCLIHLDNDIEYTSSDNIFMKGMIMEKANTVVAQHSHKYGHTSLVASGKVKVWKDSVELGEFKAPSFLYIEPDSKHKFMSLEDNTHVYCIHRVDQHAVHILEEHDLMEAV